MIETDACELPEPTRGASYRCPECTQPWVVLPGIGWWPVDDAEPELDHIAADLGPALAALAPVPA